METFLELRWLWVLILIALGLVLAFVLLIMSSIVRRSSEDEAPAATPGSPGPTPAEPTPEMMDPVSSESPGASFRQAMRFLRASVAGRDYRYQIPWYLVMGDSGSGKSTLMRSAGVDLSGDRGLARRPVEWRFLDRGVLIGAGGNFVHGASSDRDWTKLIGLFQNYRPRRPIDGVVLTVSASTLAGAESLDDAQLNARAARHAEMLSHAQRTFGFLFPVYVVVTQCDHLEGFSSFCSELPVRSRDDIFGWSSPYQVDASFTPDWVDEAFDSMGSDLQRLQSEILVESSALREPDDIFRFPEVFAELRGPLRTYLDQLFRQTAYREAFRFRGVYFCGDAEPEPQLPSDTVEQREEWMDYVQPVEPPRERLTARRSPVFLRRLLDEKILPERALARPLSNVFLTRSRTVTYIQVAAALLAVVLTAGTIFAYNRVSADSGKLLPALMKATGPMPSAQNPDQQRNFGIGLLQNMAAAQDTSYRSVFLPASLSAPVDDDVTRFMRAACERWVFSALKADLDRRKAALLYPAPDAGADGSPVEQDTQEPAPADEAMPAVSNLESIPEYQQLLTLSRDLKALQDAINIYENLRQQGQLESLDRIRQLLAYLGLNEIRPAGHLARALQSASGPTAQLAPRDVQTASDMMKAQIGDLLETWFHNNRVLANVNSLQDETSAFQRRRSASFSQIRALLDRLRRVENDLADPSFRWLGGASMDLPSSLGRVTVNPLAPKSDTELATYTRQLGEGYLNQLRNNLSGARTPLTGELLDVKGTIELSSGAKNLRLALENTAALPFVAATVEPRLIQLTVEPNRRLMWRMEPLREAVRLHGIYAQFVRDGLRGANETLSSMLSRLALDGVSASVQDLIAQAQVLQPRSVSLGNTTDDETLPEVNIFREAAEPLQQLAEQFNSLGRPNIGNSVLRVMIVQSYNLLAILDRRLGDQQPYAIKEGAWNGASHPMSLAVFDVANPSALAELLTAQRDRIKFLSQQAEPLLPFLTQYMPVRAEAQNQLIQKWQRIADDFKQYDAKRPGANLAVLEDYINTGIDKIPENSCREESTTDARQDFFVQTRNQIRMRLTDRCRAVVAGSVCSSYTRIATFFNDKLAGRFPFAPLDPKSQSEAAPEDVVSFYQIFDADSKTARATLDDRGRFGAVAPRVRQFLDQMEKLRPFVISSSPETEKEPPLTFDVVPVFRANRANENGGNQIIDWTLQVGGQLFQKKDPEHPGRWRPGNPIRLALRWANSSFYEPVKDGQLNMNVRDRNAFYEFTGRWPLIAFIKGYEAQPSDLAQTADPRPYTLKFRIKTARDPKWAGTENAPAEASAVVYLQLRISPPGGKTAVTLPPFPVSAPTIGAACEVN